MILGLSVKPISFRFKARPNLFGIVLRSRSKLVPNCKCHSKILKLHKQFQNNINEFSVCIKQPHNGDESSRLTNKCFPKTTMTKNSQCK
jgi:hypothetical protein